MIKCKEIGCKCRLFDYIPVHGSYDFKCLCKHSYRDHDVKTRKCLKCKNCTKFGSKWSCSCGLKYDEHKTVIETREERAQNGGSFGEVDLMLMGEVNQYGDKNVQLYQEDKMMMMKKKKAPSKSGNVELAVNKIKDNLNLAPKYRGPQEFMDLVEYGDKFEANIDNYNDNVRGIEPPKNISKI